MNYELKTVEVQLRQSPKEAIAQWESHYLRQLDEAVETVLENREKSPVVLLAGPSAASKTTSGQRLKERLLEQEIPAHLISMDNYFISWDAEDFPVTAEGNRDLESPLCLDIPLLNAHFTRLCAGQSIAVPIYDFPTHRRLPDRSIQMDASQGDVFIFEGIHALNPLFTDRHPEACRIYVAPSAGFARDGAVVCAPTALRLMRRLVRDYQFRGATAEYSLQLWGNVIASEKIYIEPYRAGAHAVVDTTLGYELNVLRPYVLPLLQGLGREVPCREEVDEALGALWDITPLSPELVPAASILREFIGDV